MNERPYIVAATILTDRKEYDLDAILANREAMWQISEVYLNHQGTFSTVEFMVRNCRIPFIWDSWKVSSNWRPQVRYDQDQRRLLGIVTARNMAIDYALSVGADYLLFIDSDVFPDPEGLQHLLDLDVPLCGGYVPGRGAHSHVHYVGAGKRGILPHSEDVIECDWGTCGYMLIKREVFGRLRFRWGDDPDDPMNFLSEDPAFCLDWARFSGKGFLIDKRATARHEGDLNEDEASIDAWEVVQLDRNA